YDHAKRLCRDRGAYCLRLGLAAGQPDQPTRFFRESAGAGTSRWRGPDRSDWLREYASMLTDYIAADQHFVTCPNQDTVYGGGFMSLDQQPVVVQVPDFGDRF